MWVRVRECVLYTVHVHGDRNVIIKIAFRGIIFLNFLLIILNLTTIMEVGRGMDLTKIIASVKNRFNWRSVESNDEGYFLDDYQEAAGDAASCATKLSERSLFLCGKNWFRVWSKELLASLKSIFYTCTFIVFIFSINKETKCISNHT